MKFFILQIKKKFKKISVSPLAVILVLILAVFLGRASWIAFERNKSAAELLANLEEKRRELENRQSIISSSLVKLETDAGVEEEIRNKFGMQKDGEKTIVIVDSNQSNSETGDKKNWWSKIRNFFNDF
jgi:cell division protein FtsB